MYLDKLEIFGFKSFAQKTILIFPRGITCIVGPNGCGKSNLTDAIRWILGEQSLKNLRVEKNDDLIFSAGKKGLNFSYGTLYLKNENGENNLKIERKVFRNGENEYLINDNKVRREDLLLTLAKINFGQKSYSIIGQGLVDWILYASVEERKEFFDEATGVKEYQIKKSRAEAKIKRSLTNLAQAEIVISEIEPRLRFLSRQIKKWQKRKEIEEKLIALEKEYYGTKLFRLAKEKEKINQKINERKLILKKEEENLKILQKEMENLAITESSEEFKNLEKKWRDCLEQRNKLIAIKTELEKSYQEKKEINKEKLIKIENSLKDLAVKQEELVKKIVNFKKDEEIFEIKKMAEDILKKIKGLLLLFSPTKDSNQLDLEESRKNKKELEVLDQKLKDLEEKLEKFLKIENQTRKEMFEIQKKCQEKQNVVSALNYELKELEMELVRLETKEEDLMNEIKQGAHFKDFSSLPQIEITPEKEEEYFSAIKRLKKEMELIGGFDENLFNEYKECKEKYDFFSSQINDLKKSISSLEEIKKKLNEKIKDEFSKNFKKINENFEKYFKFLFKGGRAKLVLEEKKIGEDKEKDDFQESKYGIEIYAKPAGKKIKNVQSLSGGEKALTSLALIFAILKTKKPPFIVLDEVDASLDEANSLRFVEIVKELSKKIQFIIVTHNYIIIESASSLYGVTMDKEGISRLVSLKLENF